MYRVRTPQKGEPLLISDAVIQDYSDNHVDTLHKKNLLSLGEDRYLTTLMLKSFPQYKTKFTSEAVCTTFAPNTWNVLLSQRRRWINSTVHNLVELLLIPQLCGFCLFSMRFVIFMDLLSTVLQPAGILYVAYLIVALSLHFEFFPLTSLLLIAAIYGLQIGIFAIKREWAHIGWMFLYLLALPIFGFYVPLYSFWHFDDFSWGNTRLVVEEMVEGKTVVVEKDDFDENSVPLKLWQIYEDELLEMATMASSDHESYVSSSYGDHGPQNHKGLDSSDAVSIYSRVTGTFVRPRSVYDSVPGNDGTNMSIRSGISSSAAAPVLGNHPYFTPHIPAVGFDVNMKRGSIASVASNHLSGYPNPNPNPHAYSGINSGWGMLQSIPPHPPLPVPSILMEENTGTSYMNFNTTPIQRPISAYSTKSNSNNVTSSSIHQPPEVTDEAILNAVRRLVSNFDLMTLTKKKIRDELELYFEMDLAHKRDYINDCIELALQEV